MIVGRYTYLPQRGAILRPHPGARSAGAFFPPYPTVARPWPHSQDTRVSSCQVHSCSPLQGDVRDHRGGTHLDRRISIHANRQGRAYVPSPGLTPAPANTACSAVVPALQAIA
jgi:hypothetical protein